jgi:hypothetical protein
MEAAKSLKDVYKTLSPEPLTKKDEFNAFYRSEVNSIRGTDKVKLLKLYLERSYGLERPDGAAFYKAFLMGHAGVGKSTELTRLIQELDEKFVPLRFSASTELDPNSFKPFDILLIMAIEIFEATKKITKKTPNRECLQKFNDWFATEKLTLKIDKNLSAEISSGAGITSESLWAKALGLFSNLKGELKFASNRSKEITEYRLNRIPSMIDLVNDVLIDCSEILRRHSKKEWLFIGEDFDKAGIPPKQIEDLFLTYANIFKDLKTHLIFTIPVSLAYSEKANQLPFPNEKLLCIPDTPVFHPDHAPHEEGREVLFTVLKARVIPDIFEDKQITRLIVASGGNIRDLFSLVAQAADNALLRDEDCEKINAEDASTAINNLRTDYERRLGSGPYDPEKVTYEEKSSRLVKIYHQDPIAKIPDPTLYSLLRSRAIQEFNGKRWFGVHPLVVDILVKQGKIDASQGGIVLGSAE